MFTAPLSNQSIDDIFDHLENAIHLFRLPCAGQDRERHGLASDTATMQNNQAGYACPAATLRRFYSSRNNSSRRNRQERASKARIRRRLLQARLHTA